MDAQRDQLRNGESLLSLRRCETDSVVRVIVARDREAVSKMRTVDYDLGENRNNDLGDDEANQDGCDSDKATVPIKQMQTGVEILYAGPSALEATLFRKREELRQGIAQHCENKIDPAIIVAQPPFETGDDLECRGFWLHPRGPTPEKSVKDLRKQMQRALVALLDEVQKHRPRIILSLIHI